jgi:hypothetical protein
MQGSAVQVAEAPVTAQGAKSAGILTVWETFDVYDGQIHPVEVMMAILPLALAKGDWDETLRGNDAPQPGCFSLRSGVQSELREPGSLKP